MSLTLRQASPTAVERVALQTTTFPVSAWVTFATVALAEASHVTQPRITWVEEEN